MFYTLLGKLVWKALTYWLRQKYGPTRLPKPVLAGAVLVAAIGALLVAQRRSDAAS